MKPRQTLITLGACALVLPAPFAAAKTTSDLVPPDKRKPTVELAQKLTRAPEPAPVPADLANLFNPAGFDQPDPEELKALAQAQQRNSGGGGPVPAGGPAAAANQTAPIAGDREILENLAAKLPAKGTINLGGEPLLILTGGRVKVGDKFTVAYNGQDYELELTAIDRTTFTLRYHSEEIVRPIKTGK